MRVQNAVRRVALVGFLLLVPTVAVWSLTSEPQKVLTSDNEALVTASDLVAEHSTNPAAPADVSGAPAGEIVTLHSWENTDHEPSHPTPKGPMKPPPRGPPPWAKRGNK